MPRLSTESDDTAIGRLCSVCKPYFESRAHVLAPHIARRAFIRGVAPAKVATDFMHAVHDRHLAGLTLAVE